MNAADILAVLDAAAEPYAFPILDNGYIYLAATRMSLFRGPDEWAIVIETFGYSPRQGLPSTCIFTATRHGYDVAFVNPIEDGDWIDGELVDPSATHVVVRGTEHALPTTAAYVQRGVLVQRPTRPEVFELCRYLAMVSRDDVLATVEERRAKVPPELAQILLLEEWEHPDLACHERPSECETFQQLAEVLVTGDLARYCPTREPNTHWSNWPLGGSR